MVTSDMSAMDELTFADVPCGAGGLSLGFELVGYRPVFAADMNPLRCETYSANCLGRVRAARIQDLDRLPQHDVYLAGIPCQPYSQLRWLVIHRLKGVLPEKWTDITITGEVERLIERNRPRAFVTENVRRAPVPAPGGYHITPVLVDGRFLGMLQPRVRRITFGFRDDVVPGPLPPPLWPFAGTDGVGHTMLADRRAVPVKLLAGGKPKTEPRHRRLGTVFAGHGPLRRSFAEHGRDEEWARWLQGFPETFFFAGPQDERLGQIADAVPVPMARWAAMVCRDWLLHGGASASANGANGANGTGASGGLDMEIRTALSGMVGVGL